VGNDVTLTQAGTFVYTEATGASFTLERAGNSVQLLRDGVIVDSRPLSAVTGFTLNGADGASDTLLIDYAVGGFFNLPVTFHGGIGGPDELGVRGNGTQTVVYTPDAATNGRASCSSTARLRSRSTAWSRWNFDNVGTFTFQPAQRQRRRGHRHRLQRHVHRGGRGAGHCPGPGVLGHLGRSGLRGGARLPLHQRDR